MAGKIVDAFEITGANQFSDPIAVIKGAGLHYTITKDVGVLTFLIKVQHSFDNGVTWQQTYKSNRNQVEFSSEISTDTGRNQFSQDVSYRFGIPLGGTFTGTGNIYITLRAG